MVVQPKVVVIGCGPGGLSFLHALSLRRKKLEEECDNEGLLKLPVVTVYERNSKPGGVWRSSGGDEMLNGGGSKQNSIALPLKPSDLETEFSSESSNSSSSSSSCEEEEDYIIEGRTTSSTCMYEALWTNGPSQGIEFPDYTFDEHFKHSLPIYMPRSALLEYMLARVTRHNPTIFDAVKFNASVEHVSYDESIKKFEIVSLNLKNGVKEIEYFDKCIWAAGSNGCAKIPKSIRSILQKGGFKGVDLHSSQAANRLGDMKGKNIVMIGDGLSAEDLTLEAIKLGVGKIYIIARSGNGVCSYTSSWPGNKVEVIQERAISEVIQEGRGLRLVKMEYSRGSSQVTVTDYDDTYDLLDIDAVTYCTGYESNDDMINPALYGYEEYDHGYLNDLPCDWKMESNILTEALGDIKPSETLITENEYICVSPGYFNGIFMDNTDIMYLYEGCADYPLLEIDVRAWYFLAIIVGDIELPSKSEMIEINRAVVHKAMNLPFIRSQMDEGYYKQLSILEEEPTFSWLTDYNDPRVEAMVTDTVEFALEVFAEEIKLCKYPFELGSFDGLNEKGKLLLKMSRVADVERCKMKSSAWRTFRDIDPSGFESLHTGTRAVPLKARWIDIDDKDPNLLEM